MEGLFGGGNMLLPMLLMFVVFYFFMIRPQQAKAKKEKNFIAELKKGTKVVTKSGLHAKVLEVNDKGTVILETGAGKMTFEKAAISMDASMKLNGPTKKSNKE